MLKLFGDVVGLNHLLAAFLLVLDGLKHANAGQVISLLLRLLLELLLLQDLLAQGQLQVLLLLLITQQCLLRVILRDHLP